MGVSKGKKEDKRLSPVHAILPTQSKKEDKHMRAKSLFLGISLIGMIGASVVGGTDAEAKSKTPVYNVTSKKQIKKVEKKVYVRYKKNLPTKLRGKYKYKIASFIRNKEMKANKIHYIRGLNTSTLSSKKSIKAFRRELKYLTLLIRDMDKVYAYALARKDTATYESTIYDKSGNDGWKIIGTETKHYYEGVSDSEIKSTVLGEYLTYLGSYKRSYGKDNPTGFEKIYKGTYKGNCHYTTEMDSSIARAWGFKVVTYGSVKLNHEWYGTDITNLQGVTYNTGDRKFKNKTRVNLDPETRSYIKKLQRAHTELSTEQFDARFVGVE